MLLSIVTITLALSSLATAKDYPLRDFVAEGEAVLALAREEAEAHKHSAKRDSVPAGYQSPPYYPTPKGGWVSDWSASYAKAAKVVANMTLAEKVNMTSGSGIYMGPCVGNTGSALRFGIPRLCLEDSALGVALTDNVTAFPAGITVGATFNKALAYSRGVGLGVEARGKGVNVLLGPTVGPIGRKPRGGRNWEGFGADPVLQAIGGSQTIQGMQSQGVIATIKHFIGNEQEKYRMDIIPHGLMRALSSNIDDRTMHELYMWPFAEGIRAGVGAVMTSYNEVNGSAASQNSYTINKLLKDELGFQGMTMCDWLSQISGVASALSGLDMSMPGDGQIPALGESYWNWELSTAVLNGSVPVDRLNDMVTRIVATWYQLGQDQDYPEINFSSNSDSATGPCYPGALISPTCVLNSYVDVQDDHAEIVKEISREAVTMLKNNNSALPLSKSAKIYVFGTDAQAQADPNACSYRACNTGTLAVGWGSGTNNFPYLADPITAIKAVASNVTFSNSDSYPSGISPTADDVAIVFITSDSGENQNTVLSNHGDRDYAGLVSWYSGDTLVQKAAAAFSTVIVVVHTVGPIIVEPWIDLPSVKGLLFAHLPGQEAGSTLTDVLFGDYSPSGHLPYSIPVAESDYPSSLDIVGFELGQVQDSFTEGLYIDYRYLNAHGIAPRYPFGHGLSYTTFSIKSATLTSVGTLTRVPPARAAKGTTAQSAYTNTIPSTSEVAWPTGFSSIWRYLYPYLDNPSSITVSSNPYPFPDGYQTTPQPDPPAGGSQGGNPALFDVMYTISVTVTNSGSKYSGKAVMMLFLQHPNSTVTGFDTPIIQLRDFEKTNTLAPGASQTLTLSITRKDLSVWDTTLQNWIIPGLDSTGKGDFKFWIGESSGSLTYACEMRSGTCSGGRTSPV